MESYLNKEGNFMSPFKQPGILRNRSSRSRSILKEKPRDRSRSRDKVVDEVVDEEDNCAICTLPLSKLDALNLTCDHDEFHKNCLYQWSKIIPGESFTCPICREVIQKSSLPQADAKLFTHVPKPGAYVPQLLARQHGLDPHDPNNFNNISSDSDDELFMVHNGNGGRSRKSIRYRKSRRRKGRKGKGKSRRRCKR